MSPLDFRYADGNEFSIQTLSGRKVAWIFFTTDCQHCQRQLRNFDTLAKRFDARELQIIALSLDDASSTKSFLEQYPLSIPIVVSNDKNLKQEFRVAIVPAVYLYDRHGRLVQHRLGEYSLVEDAKLLKDFIGGSFTSIGQEN